MGCCLEREEGHLLSLVKLKQKVHIHGRSYIAEVSWQPENMEGEQKGKLP